MDSQGRGEQVLKFLLLQQKPRIVLFPEIQSFFGVLLHGTRQPKAAQGVLGRSEGEKRDFNMVQHQDRALRGPGTSILGECSSSVHHKVMDSLGSL